eukprot:11981315-Karenia_brevis.AAC.1
MSSTSSSSSSALSSSPRPIQEVFMEFSTHPRRRNGFPKNVQRYKKERAQLLQWFDQTIPAAADDNDIEIQYMMQCLHDCKDGKYSVMLKDLPIYC